MQQCRAAQQPYWLVVVHKTQLVRCTSGLSIRCNHKQVLQFFDVGIEVAGKEGSFLAAAPEPQQHDAAKNQGHHDAKPTACRAANKHKQGERNSLFSHANIFFHPLEAAHADLCLLAAVYTTL